MPGSVALGGGGSFFVFAFEGFSRRPSSWIRVRCNFSNNRMAGKGSGKPFESAWSRWLTQALCAWRISQLSKLSSSATTC
jgi:hypothetical protein